MKQSRVHALAIMLSVIAGFAFTFRGFAVWDDISVQNHSLWLLMQYGLFEVPIEISDNGTWIAPLWDLIVGFAIVLLQHLRDPIWIRHALTAALFPLTLFWTYLLLRRANIQKSTAILAVSFLFGIIRLGGHALVNVRDFPAASGYLLATLLLWMILSKKKIGNLPTRDLIIMGIVATIPFLLRSPLLFHFTFLTALFVCVAIFSSDLPLKKGMRLIAIPLLSGCAFIIALSPKLWSVPLADWLHPVALFSNFPWKGPVRVMGMEYVSTDLPWWYVLSWIPVMVHPLVLALCVIGIFLKRKKIGRAIDLRSLGILYALQLHHVLFAMSAIGFLGIIFLNPVFYDEDRHLMFLYPPLILGFALLWDGTQDRTKYALASIIVIVAALSHVAWWPFAYVYKSPLILDRSAQAFMGDYRGVCLNDGIDALPGRVAPGSTVVIEGSMEAAQIQYDRRRKGLLSKTDMPQYRLTKERPPQGPYAVLAYNRINRSDPFLRDIDAGRAGLLWSMEMPPGEPACVLAWYEED